MRIVGSNSGLDIDKIVSDLMRAERMPLDNLKKKQQQLIWKEEAYRAINTQLAKFRDFLSTFRFSSGTDWNRTNATSSDTSAVTVTSNGTASAISHSIKVNQLAEGALKYSSGTISNASLVGSADLSSGATITEGDNDKFNITLDGATKTITLTAGNYDQNTLLTEIQSQIDKTFGANKLTASFNASNQLELTPNGTPGSLPQVVVTEVSGNNALTTLGFQNQQAYKVNVNLNLGAIPDKFDAGTLTYGNFVINGQTIEYTSMDSISSIINKVNSSAAGVMMSYDSVSDRFTFTSKTTGAAAMVHIEDGTGNFASMMKIDNTAVYGKDANVTIDGVTSDRSSNSFTVNGVTYNLLKTTDSNVTVNVTKDVDAAFNKIKEFVDIYNETVGMMASEMIEPRYRDYKPLTEDEKSEMKDSEIELWEEKAKSGLLRNDDILSYTNSSFRSLLSASVENVSGTFDSLYQIGITTMPYDRSNRANAGKLTIDENKLRAALEQDPQGVVELFTKVSTEESEKGIAQQLYDKANNAISRLIDRAGGVNSQFDDINTTLGLQVDNLNDKIEAMNARLLRLEDMYYRKFSAMDTAVGKSNSQLSWLLQQMG